MTLSDDEVRRKYGLPDDVPIRRRAPTKDELANDKLSLEKLGAAHGFQDWMLKTWPGRVVAVYVLVPAIAGPATWWWPKIEVSIEHAKPYAQLVAESSAEVMSEFVAFTDKLTLDIERDDLERYGTGTIFAPQTLNPVKNIVRARDEFISLNIWRILPTRLAGHAFAAHPLPVDARWSLSGAAAIYAALDLLQALVESRIPLRTEVSSRLNSHSAVRASIVGTASIIDPSSLPQNWEQDLHFTRRLGNAWVKNGKTGMLLVPSVIQQERSVALINTAHSDFRSLVIEDQIELRA